MAAIFGFQIVLSLITVSVLQKLSARYSLGRRFLCRKLYYCLHPTNEILKAVLATGQSASAKTSKKKTKTERRNSDKNNEVFSLPKQLDIPLLAAPVNAIELLQLPYYVDYRWLIDFTLCTMIVFVISEIFTSLFPATAASELNLSLVWIFISLFLSMKSLALVTALYFRGLSVSGERSLCISFGSICFLITMVLFLISDNILDIGLLEAHRNFTKTTADFLQKHDLPAPQERSPILLYLLLSMMFGFLASFLTFPCLRYARMYNDALRYAADEPFRKLLVHTSFFSPLFVLLLWIRPLAHDHLVYGENAIFTLEQFESIRLWACLSIVFVRLLTANTHLQSYLNMAYDKIDDMKKEGGRIINVELQKMIAQIFYYLCVVAIQYFAPIVLLLTLTCILKVLGQYSWLDAIKIDSTTEAALHATLTKYAPWGGVFLNATTTTLGSMMSSAAANSNNSSAAAMSAAGQLLAPSLFNLQTIFNVTVNRAVWNFFLFATSFINFFGSLVGVVYTTKFKD